MNLFGQIVIAILWYVLWVTIGFLLTECVPCCHYDITDDDLNTSIEEKSEQDVIGMADIRPKQICVTEGKLQRKCGFSIR